MLDTNEDVSTTVSSKHSETVQTIQILLCECSS